VTHRATGQTEIRATYGNVTAATTLNISISIPASGGMSIVINEFATRARDDQACGEFVEIRNDTSAPVDVGGFRILSWNHFGGRIDEFATVNPGTVLAPGCHYLIATTLGASAFGLTRDQTTTGGECPMDDEGGITLVTPQGGTVDQVGMNTVSIYKEGTALPRVPADALRQSYARTGTDTNNNASDFRIGAASPQNLASSCAVR
jgi:predicted extracellular nuclease